MKTNVRACLAASALLLLEALAASCGGGSRRESAADETSDGAAAQPGPVPGQDDGGVVAFGDATADGSTACEEAVDVVLVLDVSSSMDFVLDKLGTDIAGVVASANSLAPDAHFGLVAFVDNAALDTTGPLAGGKVHTQAATLRAAFDEFKRTYTDPNRNPGDGPTGPTLQNPLCEENAADALHMALTDFPWRANSTRVVVAVTDDTFLERPDNYGDRDGDGLTNKTDYPREGDYPARHTMAEVVAAARTAHARVFSVTRLHEPGLFDLTKCGTGRRLPWSAVSNGWSTPYGGASPIPAQTGGKNFDLDAVKSGKLSLGKTIEGVVVESHCNPVK